MASSSTAPVMVSSLPVPPLLRTLTTAELIEKLKEAGIEVSAVEETRFYGLLMTVESLSIYLGACLCVQGLSGRSVSHLTCICVHQFDVYKKDVDGETVDIGLSEMQVGELFPSFKKQLRFIKFVKEYKEGETFVVLEPVPVAEAHQAQHSTVSSGDEPARGRLPPVTAIPTFPYEVQTKLDRRDPSAKDPRTRHKIIRILYEMMASYNLYPTSAEYVQVAKSLIVRYPFLKDAEGNGYKTWHDSLKRKFKAERAPLVSDSEVQRLKEKFGHKKQRRSVSDPSADPPSPETLSRRAVDQTLEMPVGEDIASVEANVKMLQDEYKKTRPDLVAVSDLMERTFHWRRNDIFKEMPVADVLQKYPFLKTPAALYDEVDRIHPSAIRFSHRFVEGFAGVLPKLLQLAEHKSPQALTELVTDARRDAVTDDLPGINLRAGLILLPSLFKEKIENVITEKDPVHPHPTIQLKNKDWKVAITGRSDSVLKLDGAAVCQCKTLDEAFITAFCMYFAFNLEYPAYLKKTLTFLQRYIAKIVERGDKDIPTTIMRVINILESDL